MNRTISLASAWMLICWACPGMAQNGPAADVLSAKEQQSYNMLTNKWVAAFNSQNALDLATLYTEDAIRVAPTGISQGSAAIRTAMEAEFKAGGHAVSFNTMFVRPSVGVIVAGGEWSATYGDQPARGYWTSSFTREGDALRIRTHTFNIALQAPDTAQPRK